MTICNSYLQTSESPERETYAFITQASKVNGFIFGSHFLSHSSFTNALQHRLHTPFQKMQGKVWLSFGGEPSLPQSLGSCTHSSFWDLTGVVSPLSTHLWKLIGKWPVRANHESCQQNIGFKLAFSYSLSLLLKWDGFNNGLSPLALFIFPTWPFLGHAVRPHRDFIWSKAIWGWPLNSETCL
jgi:hypothetical protein